MTRHSKAYAACPLSVIQFMEYPYGESQHANGHQSVFSRFRSAFGKLLRDDLRCIFDTVSPMAWLGQFCLADVACTIGYLEYRDSSAVCP
jgi:hypothetical protein